MATHAQLAVLLHADVVGSTALVQQDERIAHERMQAAFQRLSNAIADYHGTTHEIRGDALVAEFERASDAVSAALAFQIENTTANENLIDRIRPDVRVGIALGEVIIAHRTVTGAGIVLAQRLEQLADSGGVCISAAIREALPARLPFQYRPLGEQTVKGFDEPVRVFSVVLGDTERVPAPEAIQRRRFGWTARQAIAAATLALVGLAVGAWYSFSAFESAVAEKPPSLGTPQLSIAVLPFANPNGDDEQRYFADALTDDLTTDLSRIAGSFVISRRTAAAYRGENLDPKQVARELSVRYLLEGAVRRSASEVRLNVQLIDGETGQQVWSERYQKSVGDMYAFQDEVTGRVARALNLELKDALSRRAAQGAAGDLDATDLTQRGWAELWTKPQNPRTNTTALSYISRALAIEPDNAEALGVAAYAYARAANYRWDMTREEALEKGIAAGERSISLDPKNADTLYSLAFLYFVAGETQKSHELLRQCIAANRNHAPAYAFYALNLIRLGGRSNDVIPWVERAFALSPRDPLRAIWHSVTARTYLLNHQDALAVEAAQKGIASNPKLATNYAIIASAYAHQGNTVKAQRALEEFRRLQPKATVSRMQRQLTANDPTAIKAYQRLVDGLRKAGLPD